MSTPYGPFEYEVDSPTCPECGSLDVEWRDCPMCKGEGLISCVCEGSGGDYACNVCGHYTDYEQKEYERLKWHNWRE